jgi:hypothetical protein
VIRNIVQVIAVEAETGAAVVDFQQALRQKNSDTAIPLTVQNLWAGKKYHFLVLMGHKERTYDEVGDNAYIIYKDDLPPTLLAAGFLGDQTIPEGGTTISITMKPLVVDTVFEYGGVTAPAVLGGAELPVGVEARLVWTITGGGLAVLVDAQNKAGKTSVWGEVKLTGKTTILRIGSASQDTPDPVLGGAEHNRIVLDLGALEAGASGSANFNLAYIPFGFDDMGRYTTFDEHAASWIIRNGVNDEAQDGDTTFSGSPIPWDGTVNGNGAAAFTAAQGSIDLAGHIPAPVVGGTPVTSFSTTQYSGTVKWIPNHSTFQANAAYQATVTLEPAAGHVFSADLEVRHGTNSVSPPLGSPEGGVRIVQIDFALLGIPSNLDCGGATFSEAVIMIRAARQAGAGSLSLTLDGRTAAGTGSSTNPDNHSRGDSISFSAAGSTLNSPPTVAIDGGSRVVEDTGNPGAAFITVEDGVTLTLKNITLQIGIYGSMHNPVVRVGSGGVLILEEGAVITGHTNEGEGDGGVVVGNGGRLLMKGGEISGNTAAGGNGGGVYVAGMFTMQGGTITGNNGNGNGGGGVYVDNGGTFSMRGGAVSGNEAPGNGGGVYVAAGGTFSMLAGTIGGNNTNGNGGGVYAAAGGFFVKSLGTIYGFGAANANHAATYNGHAAYAEDGGTRERDASAGPGVSLNSGNNANWERPALTASWTAGCLYSTAQVDWYSFTAVSAGSYHLRWDDSGDGSGGYKGDIWVEAYRASGESASISTQNDDGYKLPDAPFELAAGETVLVKVERNSDSSIGTYAILCQPASAISNAWADENLDAGTSTWYRFTAGNAGTYQLQWEDYGQNGSGGGSYGTDVFVSAFRSSSYTPSNNPVFSNVPDGYTTPQTINLTAGETVYVLVTSSLSGNGYRIRGYQFWDGTINQSQTAWYSFTAGTSGTYYLQWEDDSDHSPTSSYSGNITVSAYRGLVPLFDENRDMGYLSPPTFNLTAGDKVDVKVYGAALGNYTIRYYR